MQGTMPGALRRGRPRMAWMDSIKTWTGLSVEESIKMTEDRDKWRKYVHGVANLGSRTAIEQNRTTAHSAGRVRRLTGGFSPSLTKFTIVFAILGARRRERNAELLQADAADENLSLSHSLSSEGDILNHVSAPHVLLS